MSCILLEEETIINIYNASLVRNYSNVKYEGRDHAEALDLVLKMIKSNIRENDGSFNLDSMLESQSEYFCYSNNY